MTVLRATSRSAASRRVAGNCAPARQPALQNGVPQLLIKLTIDSDIAERFVQSKRRLLRWACLRLHRASPESGSILSEKTGCFHNPLCGHSGLQEGRIANDRHRCGNVVTKLRQHPGARRTDERAGEFLAQGRVAHVGFEFEGRPYVIPMLYEFSVEHPKSLYLHGGPGRAACSRHWLRAFPSVLPSPRIDGLVYSRDAKFHSANYRSVMCFGRGRLIEDEAEKRAIFDQMTLRYFPGRTAGRDYAAAPSSHLAATTVVEIVIEEMSAKMRTGGPKGPHDAQSKMSPFARGGRAVGACERLVKPTAPRRSSVVSAVRAAASIGRHTTSRQTSRSRFVSI